MACLEDRPSRPRTSPEPGAGRGGGHGSASGASGPAGARRRLADEPDIARPHSTVHQVLAPRRLLAPAATRAAGGRPLRVALPRQAAAHGRQEASAASRRPATPSPATAAAARGGSAGSTCTRSSTTARGWPTRRSTTTNGPRPSPRSPARALDWFLEPRHRRRAADDRQRTSPTSTNRSLRRAALTDARSSHIRTRPYTPRTNGKVERYQPDAPARMGLRARIRLKRTPDAQRCHTGSATTTSAAPTQRSATDRRSTAFGTSSGATGVRVEHMVRRGCGLSHASASPRGAKAAASK